MPGLEGKTFGHHHLKRLLGRGGMAEVYLARDEHLFRDVAIKVVHASRIDHFARFRREAEIIGPLAHDHILPVFEYGEEADWHYLVMPYAASGTLDDMLSKKGALSLEEAGVLLEQIASALQFAHERGILHRDIKPSNILLRDASYAYLADFGIAKSQDERSSLTQIGTIIGTPEYMAPELMEGPASPSSDIYALGIVLYQMLTGRVPFKGKTALAVLQKHVQEPPVRPSLINPALLPGIEQVILSAIEKDPSRRFRTPEALAKAYKQALRGSTANQEAIIASPLILSPPTGTRTPSALPSTVQTPLQAGLSVSPYIPPPKRKSLTTGRLVGIGIAVIIALLVLVLLLPNLLSYQGNTVTQTAVSPTATVPSATSTTVANACDDQDQVTINDTANVLDTTQICSAVNTWPYMLTISTTHVSSGEGNLTDKAKSLLTNDNTVVMAIGIDNSSGHRQPHIVIIGGDSVQISDRQYRSATEAFTRRVNAGDYTRATIAAIEALQAPDQKQKQNGND
jgi:serine/threonine protein kinase